MLSEVPDGWSKKALKDICVLTMGQSPKSTAVNDEGCGIPFLQGCAEFGAYEPTFKAWIEQPLKVAKEGDILFSVRAPVGKMNYAPTELCIGRGLCSIRATVVDSEFLKYTLEFIAPVISSQSQGSTFQAVNKKQLEDAWLLQPPLTEQKRIAEVLSSVDESIQATQRLIEQAERVKQGLMEELLTGGLGSEAIERGEVPEGWQRQAINECLSKVIDYRGKAPPKSEKGIPLITAKNIRMGFISFDSKEYIDEAKYDSWMVKGFPKAGDVMFTTEAPLANVALYPKDGMYALGQRVITLQVKPELNTVYLYFLLQSAFMRSMIFKRATGSTAKGIKSSEFKKIEICFPSVEMQERISAQLMSMNDSVAEYKSLLAHYSELKKGLMDDLLTGKVRTV